MTDDDIKAFAFQQTPALAANITRLCGKVIEQGLTGILEHACALQQQVTEAERERDALKLELGRAYRCVQGMHNALHKGSEFADDYHAPTIGAAKRFVFEGDLSGGEYFIGKPVEVLHAALKLPAV